MPLTIGAVDYWNFLAEPVAARRTLIHTPIRIHEATLALQQTGNDPMVGDGTRKTTPRQAFTTASADEVARFTAMAESWWEREGNYAFLHKINPLRIAYIRDHAAGHFGRDPLADKPLKNLTLLDIGCGGGLLSEPMRRLAARVTGIDASETNIAVAGRHARQCGLDIDYRCVLPENLADKGRSFDIVLHMEVIEHVANPQAFLRICSHLVRPGGTMIMSTINRTPKAFALAKVGAEYVLRMVPAGTHDWRKFIKPSELAAGLRPHGVEIIDLAGLTYNPLGGEWALSRDLGVNYLAFAVKGRVSRNPHT